MIKSKKAPATDNPRFINAKSKIPGLQLLASFHYQSDRGWGEAGLGYDATGKLIAWEDGKTFGLGPVESFKFQLAHSTGAKCIGLAERGAKATIERWEKEVLAALEPQSYEAWLRIAPEKPLDKKQSVTVTIRLDLEDWQAISGAAVRTGKTVDEVLSDGLSWGWGLEEIANDYVDQIADDAKTAAESK